MVSLNGQLEVVKFFLEKGTCMEEKDENRQTPLDLASESGQPQILSTLSNSFWTKVQTWKKKIKMDEHPFIWL